MRGLLLAALVLLVASPALAQGKDDKKKKLIEKAAQKLGVPADDLAAAGGERWLVKDAATRRAFLTDLGATPRGGLLPLVVEAALEDDDFECRHAAVKLLSVVGLDADRSVYLAKVVPAIPKLVADKSELIYLDAAEELTRLERWFRCDEDVSPTFEKLFTAGNIKVAGRGLQGLLRLEHPTLRAGPATKALVEVLRPTSRFSPIERKRAVLAIPDHRDAATPQALAGVMLSDGPIAVEIAQVLGKLGDPSVLPTLRKVDRTSSHALRIPAYRARGALDDATLIQELPTAVDSDHVAIQTAILEAVGRLTDRHVDEVLERAATAVKDPGVRRVVGLMRLRRGSGADVELLRPFVAGTNRDGKVTDEVLDIAAETTPEAAGPLVKAIADDPDQGGRRERAVDLLGRAKLCDDSAKELLKRLAKEGDPSALRLRASASLLQLGHPVGVAAVGSALEKLDVVSREDAATPVGTAKRFSGSPLLDVVDRWADTKTTAAIAVIISWLEPKAVPAAAPPPAKPADPKGGGTTVRGGAPPPAATVAVEFQPWMTHPFVRRGVVEALGRLTLELPEEERGPALKALGKALDDPAGVVRAVAVRALVRISNVDRFPPGASVAVEKGVDAKVRAWLASR